MCFSVPSDEKRRKAWINAIEKYQAFDSYASKFYVCELHFEDDDIIRNGAKTNLKPNVLPTEFPSM